ncbi:MAG: heparinase II/III family protein [Pseudomonadota bacterium]
MVGQPPKANAPRRLPGQVSALALAVGLRRQAQREWRGTPLHRWMLARPRPDGLATSPVDPRPGRPENGRRLMVGDFTFAGATLHAGAKGDPWDRPNPSRRFAVALHRFDWLRDLLALGDSGAAEGLRLTLAWRRIFGRWNGFSWDPDTLERRVFNLACGAKAICARASDAEEALIALDLARQARHLLSAIDSPARAAERSASAALAGAVLSGEAGEKLAERALERLARALPATVLPDGGHASRSPQAALSLLLDLQTLDAALVQRGMSAPEEMMRAIDRLTGAVRFFTLADGALPVFQGGEAARPALVAAARAHEAEAARTVPAQRNGYQRLESRSLQLIADVEPPAAGPWSVTACAQPLAVEILIGGRRAITNSGWSPDAVGPEALRLIDAASTASLGDLPCGEPVRGLRAAALGPRLIDAFAPVSARRHQAEGALWLEMAHDGWVRRFGLRHERRLYLDLAADELRGEDRFTPVGDAPTGEDARRFIPFVARFHVHPEARASLARDGKSVLIKPEGEDTGWWLRNDAMEVAIESSVVFQDGQARRTSQIVLRGQVRQESGARLRWKLAAAEPWPPPR